MSFTASKESIEMTWSDCNWSFGLTLQKTRIFPFRLIIYYYYYFLNISKASISYRICDFDYSSSSHFCLNFLFSSSSLRRSSCCFICLSSNSWIFLESSSSRADFNPLLKKSFWQELLWWFTLRIILGGGDASSRVYLI